MKLSMMALVAGAALLCASPARAQDQWLEEVAIQLDAVVEALDAEGMSLTSAPHAGALNEGDSEEVELELQAGTYLIVGMCDSDCSDLDLLLSENGEEVDSDFEMDDTPVLAIEVEEGSTFSLRVDMATCSNGPCRYGIGIFSTDN